MPSSGDTFTPFIIIQGNGKELGDGFTGVMQFTDPLEWPVGSGSGVFLHYAVFKLDIVQFYVSSDGEVLTAGGLLKLFSGGINLLGPVGAITFEASDSYVVRSGSLGFGMVNGASTPTPYWSLTSDAAISGTNEVTNGDFETGDMTGWTASDVGFSAIESSIFGRYRLTMTSAAGDPRTVTSDRVAFSAGAHMAFSFVGIKAGAEGQVLVKWYDAASGGTLLRTDTMEIARVNSLITAGTKGWGRNESHLVSPASTASFEVVIDAPGSYSNKILIDSVAARVSSVLEMMVLREDGPVYSHNGVEIPIMEDGVGFSTYASNAGEVDVYTYTVKANSLKTTGNITSWADGDVYNGTGAGRTARIRVYFGGTLVSDTGAVAIANGLRMSYHVDSIVVNSDAAHQRARCRIRYYVGGDLSTLTGESQGASYQGPAVATTSDAVFKVTCLLSASSASLDHRRLGAGTRLIPQA